MSNPPSFHCLVTIRCYHLVSPHCKLQLGQHNTHFPPKRYILEKSTENSEFRITGSLSTAPVQSGHWPVSQRFGHFPRECTSLAIRKNKLLNSLRSRLGFECWRVACVTLERVSGVGTRRPVGARRATAVTMLSRHSLPTAGRMCKC